MMTDPEDPIGTALVMLLLLFMLWACLLPQAVGIEHAMGRFDGPTESRVTGHE